MFALLYFGKQTQCPNLTLHFCENISHIIRQAYWWLPEKLWKITRAYFPVIKRIKLPEWKTENIGRLFVSPCGRATLEIPGSLYFKASVFRRTQYVSTMFLMDCECKCYPFLWKKSGYHNIFISLTKQSEFFIIWSFFIVMKKVSNGWKVYSKDVEIFSGLAVVFCHVYVQ